jgi:hypothetical protein
MDPTIKAEWIKRLLSGDYEQGQGLLHHTNDNTFCCLGVLCEIAVEAGVVTKELSTDRRWYCYKGLDHRSGVVLIDDVLKWAGLVSNGSAVVYDDKETLASLNDKGILFKEIADVIEEKL